MRTRPDTDDLAVTDWTSRNDALVADLTASGVLTDPRWRGAFRATPRHVFVPAFNADDGTLVTAYDPATRQRWLTEVYGDHSLTVQRTPVPGQDRTVATSSSTRPSLMARMLELLALDDGPLPGQVLEIGTATGYNTALLSRVLGDEHVVSVELHPDLAANARHRLARLGHFPILFTGDGSAGAPGHAPYNCILATCATAAIPPAWIDQLADGGLIVTDLRTEVSSALTVLTKTAPDRVDGRLLGDPGHFMWMRPDPANPFLDPTVGPLVIDHADQTDHTMTFDPSLLADTGLRTILGILEPTIHAGIPGDNKPVFLHTDDGSWCEITPVSGTTVTVSQAGPRRLWPAIDRAHDLWLQHRRPTVDRIGLTARADGHTTYWIDEPDNESASKFSIRTCASH